MRQAAFEARFAQDWSRFEAWLDRHDQGPRRSRGAARRPRTDQGDGDRAARRDPSPTPLGTQGSEPSLPPHAEIPQLYRRLCQHLALARERQYSPGLVDRLNRLALRGHHLLYGARGGRTIGAGAFIAAGFPRLVRAEAPLVLASAALFFGPLIALATTLQWFPDLVYYLLEPERITELQQMYDPANERLGQRGAEDNVMMFGFYVWNNVRIGFQTFATGLAFGLGSIFFLVANGVLIGAAAGHLTQIGLAEPFWSFVAGHSAMELVAIVISGAAGLRLGAALIAPGPCSRRAALVAAARPAVRLVYGAAAMFLIAAFIEAFWSPLAHVAPAIKYQVGLLLWAVVLGYLILAGRDRGRR